MSEMEAEKKSESVQEFQVALDLLDKSKEAKTYNYFIRTFDRGMPEQYCNMREKVKGLAQKLGYSTRKPGEKDKDFNNRCTKHLMGLYSAVLDGTSLQAYKEKLNSKALCGKGSFQKFQEAINTVAKNVFRDWEKAYSMQCRYLKKGRLKMFLNLPKDFAS